LIKYIVDNVYQLLYYRINKRKGKTMNSAKIHFHDKKRMISFARYLEKKGRGYVLFPELLVIRMIQKQKQEGKL